MIWCVCVCVCVLGGGGKILDRGESEIVSHLVSTTLPGKSVNFKKASLTSVAIIFLSRCLLIFA